MSQYRLGINGFGRIGRLVCRAAIEGAHAQVVAVNDPFMDIDYMIYQFKYDSVHGRYLGEIHKDGDYLVISGHKIRVFREKDPAAIKWGEAGADIVCESTGVFLSTEACQKHIAGGNYFSFFLLFYFYLCWFKGGKKGERSLFSL